MDTGVEDEAARSALALLDRAVDGLLDLPLDALSDDDVLAIWQHVEADNRRLAVVDHQVVSAVQRRRLDFVHGASSIVVLARQVLRIPRREAAARIRAAEAAGPRVTLSGEALPPIFGSVAAAQRAGDISPTHARMIVRTVDRLSPAVQDSDGAAAESLLVEQAGRFDPDTFARLTQRLSLTLDPDGPEPDYERQQHRRSFRLLLQPDGSSRPDGEFTAELTAHLRVAFDALAKPVPGEGGIRDVRSQPQRDHDALLELVTLAERTDQLTRTGGVTTTLILTCDARDWEAGTGRTRTGHGLVLPTTEAKRWVSGDTKVIGVALDRMKAVQAYSDCRRIFTENQRLAMTVRDQGCVFPGCDVAPQRCQAHHIEQHANGGPTSITNGCLLCAFHHRMFEQMGWQIVMLHAIPHLIPPRWRDPDQKPIRNHLHDPAADLLGG